MPHQAYLHVTNENEKVDKSSLEHTKNLSLTHLDYIQWGQILIILYTVFSVYDIYQRYGSDRGKGISGICIEGLSSAVVSCQ